MTTTIILFFLVTILLFLVILQVTKASELVGALRGQEQADASQYKINTNILSIVGVLFLLISVGTIFTYKKTFLPVAASEQGVWIDQLISVTFWLTIVVFVLTHALMFWFVYKYQYGKSKKAYYFTHDNRLELIWTIVPTVVLTILVATGLQKWFKIFQPAPTEAVVIEATAKQFMWMIRYPGMDNALGDRDFTLVNSQNELGIKWNQAASHDDFLADEIVLPVNRPVLVKIGALDVLHNFYLPHFRLKMDAVPGVPTKFWFRPTITTDSMRQITGNKDFNYELACNQLCGTGHYNMRKVVRIVSDQEYNAWKREQKPMYTGTPVTQPVADQVQADSVKTTL